VRCLTQEYPGEQASFPVFLLVSGKFPEFPERFWFVAPYFFWGLLCQPLFSALPAETQPRFPTMLWANGCNARDVQLLLSYRM